ncbi:MAG: excinuclease ABC subunit UvrA, partial [Candidatus Dadabacteria bacterium]|nr:excinuclease ABC subunit UvrA [Candidatus Dadabacteria bacterium]
MAKTAKRNGYIKIKGARENNLKNIDVLIPQNRFTVVTGLSGSGKSSLVLDTVYKEGLRRYIDCLSTYARQFIEKVERPAMDDIEGLPTPIAIESRNSVINSRSTVGTTTEIYDYMRLLFAKIGKTRCPECEERVTEHSPQSIMRLLIEKFPGKRAIICFETEEGASLSQYMKKGYSRAYKDGKTEDIEKSGNQPGGKTQIVTARTTISERSKSRITEALEAAFSEDSRAFVHIVSDQSLRFSKELRCDSCDTVFEKPTPNMFSFNSPY